MFFVKLLLRPLYYCRPCLSRYYSSKWLWQEEFVLSLVMSGSVPDEPCSVSGLLLLRCSSADATSQVNWCYVAGHDLLRRRSWCAVQQVGFSGWDLRRCGSYSSDFRRQSPAKNQTCDAREGDLRRQMGSQHYRSGRPATPYGEPALQEWKTCDTICFTAAISVAGPQQTIGPATQE